MTRIGTYGANQMYLSRMKEVQARVATEQVQVATEKKSMNYIGISQDANRLVNFENEKARASKFITDNTMANTRLQAAGVSMTAMEKTMKDFRDRLTTFFSNTTRTQQDVESLQEWSFRSMIDMQSYLSANVDGQYIFAGGRVSNEPVQLPASSLSEFQAIYDGVDNPYPTTRSAQMFELHTTNAVTGDLTFDSATGTISAPTLATGITPNPLANIPVGARLTVSDPSGGVNDGKMVTVRSVTTDATGTTLSVSPLTSETPAAATVTTKNAAGIESTVTGGLTILPGSDTIVMPNGTGMVVGQTFTVSGTDSNDGCYEVASVIHSFPDDTVTIKSAKVVDEVASTTATLNVSSWYKGDTLNLQQRVDVDRTVDMGVYASDPAFEKAFRAMGLIAQGSFGTAGSLENNLHRVDEARYLIHDALDNPAGPNPPFDEELTGDIQVLQSKIGVTQALIKSKNDKHQSFIGFLDQRIIDLENVDKTEAVTRLMDDQNALQASYQALAKTREYTLLDFMK